MKNKTNNHETVETRRTFIKSTAVAAAGLLLAPPVISRAGTLQKDQEALALNGGPKAVTASHDDSETWPRYGAEVDKKGISLPYFTREMPELNEQYITAFEKVWAHRKELAES